MPTHFAKSIYTRRKSCRNIKKMPAINKNGGQKCSPIYRYLYFSYSNLLFHKLPRNN